MERRSFIQNSLFSGLSFFVIPDAIAMFGQAQKKYPGADEFPLDEMTIDILQEKMNSGALSSRKITELYLQRIAAIDKSGYNLRSVIELNPQVLEIADAMDAERRNKKIRSKMHGIPVLIKDNINTGDQMQTTAGSLALAGHKALKDAGLVKKLRASGAVIMGKTNLSEFANFRSTRSSSGWSSRGGQTLNPYVLDCSPCGSSSGSGVSVAANLCAVAIGTETDGSIACPSSVNGIVGIKPTVGLVSRAGVIPISSSQDTAGPMARTVTDAAILLGSIAGVDADDEATIALTGHAIPDYTKFLQANGLKGKRIGYDPSVKRHEAVDKLMTDAMEQMKSAGSILVPVSFVSEMGKLRDPEFQILQYEFKDGINRYLKSAKAPVANLAAIIEFNNKHADDAMPFFKQELLTMCEAKGDLTDKTYIEALEKMTAGRKFITDLLENNQLDAICIPANGASWSIDLVNGDSFTGYGGYSTAAKTGLPSITVPMGFVHELPIGLCFFSKAFDESGLISVAYAYEQVSKKRKKPEFRKSVGKP